MNDDSFCSGVQARMDRQITSRQQATGRQQVSMNEY
jgi:hypothetical protein